MAKRVKRTGKDDDGDITKLCGDWGSRSKKDAIDDIESGSQDYYVDEAGYRSDVYVKGSGSNKYLTTTADESSKNNLDNLPDC